jgi:hypothetical protein
MFFLANIEATTSKLQSTDADLAACSLNILLPQPTHRTFCYFVDFDCCDLGFKNF